MNARRDLEEMETLDALVTDALLEELAEAMPTAYTCWRIQQRVQRLAGRSRPNPPRRGRFRMEAIPRATYFLTQRIAWVL